MSWFTGGEKSGTPIETRPGTELLGQIFEDVLRTGDFGRLGAQGFGFAAFPGGGSSASIGSSPGAFGLGGGLGGSDPKLVRGQGYTQGGESDPNAPKAKRKQSSQRSWDFEGEDPAELIKFGMALGSSLPQFQFGGNLRPGQTGIAGEAGPELLTATNAGTQITPLMQAGITPPQGSPLGPLGGSLPNRGGPSTGMTLPPQTPPFEQAALDVVQRQGVVPGEAQGLIAGAQGSAITPEVQQLLSMLQGGAQLTPQMQTAGNQLLAGGSGLTPEASQILQTLQGGTQLSPQAQAAQNQLLAGGTGMTPEVQQLLGLVQGGAPMSPEVQQLLQNVQTQAGAGPESLVPGAQALNEQLFSALQPFEDRQLEQQAADIREGFSGIGNRLSTNLLGAETQMRGELTGQFQRGRAENLQNALNSLIGSQQQGAATQASLVAPLLQSAQQQLATQAGAISPLLQAAGQQGALQAGALGDIISGQQQQLSTQAGALSPLLSAAAQNRATQAGTLGDFLGAGQQQLATQAGAISPLLSAEQAQRGNLSSLAQSIIGAGQQQLGTQAQFIPQLMGAQTQAQLASLAPIELLARFFSPGAPNYQQGILGDLLSAGATYAGAKA